MLRDQTFTSRNGMGRMDRAEREKLKEKLYSHCPEIKQLGLSTIVLGRGRHY